MCISIEARSRSAVDRSTQDIAQSSRSRHDRVARIAAGASVRCAHQRRPTGRDPRHIAAHARPDMQTPIDGLLLSKVRARRRTGLLADRAAAGRHGPGRQAAAARRPGLEYRARRMSRRHRRCCPSPATTSTSARHTRRWRWDWCCARPPSPPCCCRPRPNGGPAARSACRRSRPATAGLTLDAVARMLRLLDHPADMPVLAPLIEQEILWRLLTGPHGTTIRQIGLADSICHMSAGRSAGSATTTPSRCGSRISPGGRHESSAFHRHFRAVTAMSPLQFQKRIRLQQARSLLRPTRATSPASDTRRLRQPFAVQPRIPPTLRRTTRA